MSKRWLGAFVATHRGLPTYVPVTISDRSRIVTWLWKHTRPGSWLNYDRAHWLARRLP